MPIQSYRDLIVWEKSVNLATSIHRLVQKLPREEIWGIGSQMKNAAVSIPSNIAEGSRRDSKKDFRRFLTIAYGSGAELETQLHIAKQLDFVDSKNFKESDKLLDETMRMLNKLIKTLE